MAANQRTVDLVIRARDESQRALNSAKSALDRFTAASARTAARRDLLAGQEKSARQAQQAYIDAASAADTLGRKLSAARRPSAALKAEFDQAREAARRAKQEFLAVGTSYAQTMGKAGAGTGSFAAFDAVARGATRAEAGIETLTNATVRNTAATGANAAALRRQSAAMGGTGAGRGFLGLRPHDLSNLSYQVNDVVTGLAMGQAPLQIFAQQGGQIAQIFPRAAAGLLRFLPVLGLITAALSPFITSLSTANAEAATLKEFDLLLTRSGNAAAYTAPKLAAVAAALDRYDGSLNSARAALTEFVGDAVAPEYLERFGKASLDLARVMEMDVTEAAKTVSDAFTGNADAILALDDQLGFLTETERKHAEGLRTQRRDAELRTQAFAAFERQYGETAAKMRGPWSQILADFGAAWNAFADAVNLIDFREASAKIDRLVARIQRLTGMLPGANKSGLDNMRATLLRNFAEIERIEDAQAAAREGGTLGRGGDALRVRQQAERAAFLRRENTDLRRRIALEVAQQPGNGLLGPTADPADTTTRPPVPAYTPRRAETSDADREAKQRAAFLESLRQESVARQFQLSLIDMTERQTRVLTALEQARVRAAELGLQLTADQVETIEREVRAQYDAEQAARGRQMIEQATLELAQARGEVEAEAAFVTRKLREAGLSALGDTDAATGDLVVMLTSEAAAYAEILRQIHRVNEATRQRAAAEKQVSDLTSQRSDLQARASFLRDSGRGAEADAILPQIEGVNAQLVSAIDNAIAMWAAIGGPEAEAAIATLQTGRDVAQGLASDLVVSGRQINEMLADGATNALDQFFQSLGEGANAIHALGDAFRSFAADFLRQIAQMIAKQAALNLLQGVLGVGGAIAGFVGGLFRHSGGLVGEGGGYRPVPLSAFAGARRFHGGGMPGLKRNEVPTIVEDTEGVFTKGQMAAMAPVGKGAGSVKVVNVWDPAEAVERGVATERGERVMMNFIGKNAGAIKAMLA